jgi:hypothetical protein
MLPLHDQGRGPWIFLHLVSGPWTSFVAALDKGQCRKAVCRRYSNRSKKHTLEGTKAVLKGRKPGLFVKSGQNPCSWIRIPNTDPDPGQPNECGSTTPVFYLHILFTAHSVNVLRRNLRTMRNTYNKLFKNNKTKKYFDKVTNEGRIIDALTNYKIM